MYKTPVLFLLIALLCFPIAACEGSEENVQLVIQSRYDQFNRAWAEKDRKGVEEIFATECKLQQLDDERALSLAQFMRAIEFSFRAMTVVSAKTTIESFALSDDTAEVAANIITEIKMGSLDPNNKSGPQANKSTQKVRDTWKKTADTWRIVRRVIEN